MSNIEELKEKAERLAALMKDPHPGLFTWRDCYLGVVARIADFASNEAILKIARDRKLL